MKDFHSSATNTADIFKSSSALPEMQFFAIFYNFKQSQGKKRLGLFIVYVCFNHPLLILILKIYCFKFVRYSPTSEAICFCLGTEGTTHTLFFVQKTLRVESSWSTAP